VALTGGYGNGKGVRGSLAQFPTAEQGENRAYFLYVYVTLQNLAPGHRPLLPSQFQGR